MSEIIKTKVHYTNSYMMDPSHPITITVIGCGATGSLLIPKLARLDFALKQFDKPGLHIKVFDGDIVEEHNCKKQNFFTYDVGDFKASNIVGKVNKTYGLQWEAINKFVNENTAAIVSNIVITCVDNASVRMSLKKMFDNHKTNHSRNDYKKFMYWLDCGNGNNFGQVVLGTIGDVEKYKGISSYEVIQKLPDVVDLFGDLNVSDTKEAQGMDSCSFLESLAQQDLFINDQVSNEASKILWTLLKNNVITFNGVIINQESGRTVPIMLK